MTLQRRQVLALFFSILLVTSTLTPAAAALESPGSPNSDGFDLGVSDLLSFFERGPDAPGGGNGKGKGKGPGKPTTGTTTAANDGTTTVETTRPGNGNGPPENRRGPPENPGGGPPENPGGPSKNPGGGPPENPGGGPPAWTGGPGADREPGPPEWVRSSNTPPAVGNRSALKNRSEALAGANVNVTIEDDASAVDYRLAAIDALQNADFDGPGRSAERHRTKALEALDDSLAYVLDANRTTAAELFELDKRASTPPKFAPNVTKLLVRSDERLAETAIADAERVNETLHARNVSFDVGAVEENVSEAKAAVERAERFRERGRDHAAVSQYRVAWIHAQQALDLMDLAVTPNVTVTTREDMPHEGNVTYEVRGRVFDVRGHELDPLTLSFNGEDRSVALDVNTTPGAVGTFSENLTLTRKVNDVEVFATDPNRRWAPDADDADPTTGTDTLWLDADGLPDRYELNASATDPLDYDSNSTRTGVDESNNSVIDGVEDHDGDGVSTYYEYLFELKPHDPDTDDDGLLDGFEQRYRGVDPVETDTDADDVTDGDEDLDADGLANLREQNESTNPIRPDSDFDDLNDSAELTNGTDPLEPDTDGDGLPDGEELELGTDPTVEDTDGDGVLDGEETFSTETKNETVGAAVEVAGKGNVAAGITVENETNERIQTESVLNAAASEVLHFESEREFDHANLTIDYDEKRVGDEDDLAVYTYNRSLQTYVRLPSSVDAANDTVTGTTPHFSAFVVLNGSSWERQRQVEPDPNYALDEDFSNLDGWECEGDCEAGKGVSVGPGADSRTASVKRIKPRARDGGDVSINCIPTPDGDCILPGDPVPEPEPEPEPDLRPLPGQPCIFGIPICYPEDPNPNPGDDDCYGTSIVGPRPVDPIGPDPVVPEPIDPEPTDPEPTDPNCGPGGNPGSGPGSNPPTLLGSSELERSVDVPADAIEATLTADVSGFAEERNASAEVLVVVDGNVRTVFRVDGKGGRRVTDSAYVREDVLDAAGGTVQIRIRTENLSNVHVGYVDLEITRDSDGDGLSNSLETLGILTGDNGRVYTDPYDADTDGDGLRDNREVGEKRHGSRGISRTYYLLDSDPTSVDSDGDGIDDYEERYGSQTVRATKSPDDSKEFLAALYSGDDPGTYLDTDSADTDPLYADTDTDGLSDSREIELGTNPERVDTDGDSIDDDRELKVGADPTLHDYEGPEISIFAASYWTTAWPPETHYRVRYGATDPSGVMRVRIQKEGETRIDSRFGDAPTSVGANQYFTTGVVESSVTALSGTSVEVKATDRHRNHRAMTALERSNFYGSLAKEIGPKSSVSTAGDLGLLSGFTVGAGGTAKTAKAILEDPFGFLGALQQMASMMTQLGLLEKILKTLPSQMVKSVQDKQDRSNPYHKQMQEDHYKAFQYNWYLGYGGYFLLSMVVGGQATKAAKNTKTFSKVVDKLDQNGKLTQANRYLDATKARTTGAAKKAGYTLGKRTAKGSYHLSKRSGRRVLSGVKTAGQQVRVAEKLSNAEGTTLSKIDGFNNRVQRKLGPVLGRTDDPEIAADGGESLVDTLYRADDIDPDVAVRFAKLQRRGDLSEYERQKLMQAYENGRIDNNELRRVSKLLDDKNQEYLYDDDVSIRELLSISDEADLSDVHMVVKDGDENVRPLLQGRYNPDDNAKDTGWVYIKGRHVHGEQMDDPEKGSTDFFPVGQTVKGRYLEPTQEMDDKDIKKMVFNAIKDSSTDRQDRITYEVGSDLESKTGVSEIRVVIRNGRVRQAYPTEGSAVHKWIQELAKWKDEL